MPSPTFEKPMPAMYWPSAMLPRAVRSPLTEARRFFAMISMALMCIISVSSQAPFVMKPSMACTSASMPVEAQSFGGIDMTMSSSTMATTGMSCGSAQTNLR